MHLSQKQQTFLIFFAFFKFPLNLEHFQKKVTLIGDFFPKLGTWKQMGR